MKIPKLFQKNKLQATTSTARPVPRQNVDEPDIKLSSAVLVVLVLHIVAIGGIYAFNMIKSSQPVPDPPVKKTLETADVKPAPAPEQSVVATKSYRVKSGDTLAKISTANDMSVEELETLNGFKNATALRIGQEIKIPAKAVNKPIAGESHHPTEAKSPDAAVKDSGETYTTVKGDNPVAIARRLHVNYDELLKLNKIDDPKKLQIGQKLRIPAKHKNDVASNQ